MGYQRLSTLVACVAALFSVACGESRTLDDADASIVVNLDGAMIDAGVDGGPPSNVGAACTSDGDCTGGADVCLQAPDVLPGGYCTRMCAGAEECPEGSTCVELGRGQAFCMDSCDPAGGVGECRAGYGCTADDPMLPPPFCLGGCEQQSDCPEGLQCDPDGGQAGEGNCYDPSAEWGDACETESECPAGAFCLAEEFSTWPGGACVAFAGCDIAGNTGCPDGSQCIPNPLGFGRGGICVAGCSESETCSREDYACEPVVGVPERSACQPACTSDSQCDAGSVCNVALGTCAPPFDASQLGEQCSQFGGGPACTGGTCFSESRTGYPGAYCAYEGCTVGDDSTCPENGVCVAAATEGAPNVCHRGCAFNTDCRAGYTCRDADGDGPGTAAACTPQCTEDSHCANRDRGFVCEVATGLCRAS